MNKLLYKVPLESIKKARMENIGKRLSRLSLKIYKLEMDSLIHNKRKDKNNKRIKELKDCKDALLLEFDYLTSYCRTWPIRHKKED